jgi:hypothetical protein
MVTQAISPPPPVATLGPGPADFQKNPRICGESGKFVEKVADLRQTGRSRVWGGPWWIYPKPAVFLIILKLWILI